MRKTIKKSIAVIAAAASLAFGMTAVSANAATGYTSSSSFSGGKGTLSVSSSTIYASTTASSSKYLYVNIYDYSGTLSSSEKFTGRSDSATSVYARIYGSFTHGWSYHEAGSSSAYLSVSK